MTMFSQSSINTMHRRDRKSAHCRIAWSREPEVNYCTTRALLLLSFVNLINFRISGVDALKINSITQSDRSAVISGVHFQKYDVTSATGCPVLPPFYCVQSMSESGSAKSRGLMSERKPASSRRQYRIAWSESLDAAAAAAAAADDGATAGQQHRRRRFPRFSTGCGDDLSGKSDVVHSLSLAHCGLDYIPAEAFQCLQVHQLDLQGNNFSSRISSRAFDSRTSKTLVSVNLAWSNITRLHAKLFRRLISLRNLSLSENRIRQLDAFTFRDLRSMQSLSLAGNKLAMMEPDLFRYQTSLLYLDLGYCGLRELPWTLFSGLWSLRQLDLRGNRLRHIDADTFSDLTSLQTLLLSHNALSVVGPSTVFRGLTTLRVLRLNENRIGKVDRLAFDETPTVEVLDLGDNRLQSLPPGTLTSMPLLKDLSIDGNRLEELPTDVAYLIKLKRLDVSYNRIRRIDKCLLDQDHELEYLNLRENPFDCSKDCSLFWLRHVRIRLLKRWVRSRRMMRMVAETDNEDNEDDNGWLQSDADRPQRMTVPFVPGHCWTPLELRGVSITGWLDWDCMHSFNGSLALNVYCNKVNEPKL